MSGPDVVCICNHVWSEHYIYSLNGHDQMRCRACDPHTGRRMPTLYAMTAGSHEAAMFHAADHDFVARQPEMIQ